MGVGLITKPARRPRPRTRVTAPAPGRAPELAPQAAPFGARSRLLAIPLLVMALATPASFVFHYVNRYYFGRGYPWSTFLVAPRFHFGDYYLSYVAATRFGPGRSTNMVYSPVMHLFMAMLTLLHPWQGFALVVVTFLAVLGLICWRLLAGGEAPLTVRAQHVAILVLLSYPVLFVIDRGNLEMVMFVVLALFFYLYYGRHSRWAWLPLAFAIAGKYYWVTLLVLPLSDRQMRQAVYALAGSVVLTLGSAVALALQVHASVSWVLHAMVQTLGARGAVYRSMFIVQHAHTLWASMQLGNGLLDYPLFNVAHLDGGYILVAAMLFVLIAYEVVVHDMEPWQRVLALVAATLVLPVESYDYTLLHLYFPLALLVCCAPLKTWTRVAALLIGVCLVPWDYHYFTIWTVPLDVGISTFIYAGALVALILIALLTGPRSRRPLGSLLVWDSWRDGATPTAEAGIGAPPGLDAQRQEA
jgi:hypothetical protein